nr:hypothetical protein [Lachnospiraceae bacterium]
MFSRKKLKEKYSIFVSKYPGRAVLMAIVAFNILFILLSAAIISSFALDGTEHMSFLRAAFCTIMMILDAGCIQFVVEDIGVSGIAITVICIIIVLLGMIVFTGAIIGYITNYISDFIANANAGNRKLNVSEHVVILNWNTRASEIINDLMYCDEKRVVVVLTKSRKAEIEQEIYERLTDTVNRENAALKDQKKRFARDYHEKITVIVKEGDVFSSKQLQDISLDQARTVIILGDEQLDDTCGFKQYEKRNDLTKGNTQTVKTLMQVADITASATSFDDQKVIVEITDNWTWDIVSRIKDYKQIKGKCNIIPVRVNKVLGQLLSQFSIMPELNIVYKELLSNKGVAFYYEEFPKTEEDQIAEFLYHHNKVIPLEITENDGKTLLYYAAIHENDLPSEGYDQTSVTVDYNHAYKMDHKHVIILGHNSKIEDIMDGFMAFRTEWADDSEEGVLDVVVIDDENSLERMDHYKR